MRPTLVGVATGNPDGGVAVVRLSGSKARQIAEILAGSVGAPRRLVRRRLELGVGDHEDALVAWMPGPNSFTGEDVVELHVHGGAVNVGEVVQACLDAGASAAGPGDFSRRAFEHGRLTLAQSEGVAALIGAKTRAGAAQARRLVAGELGEQVRRCADAVAALRVEVEAYLDFPDDVNDEIMVGWALRVAGLGARVDRWLSSFEAGRRAREVPKVVLAGPPNAGKSSLLNALLGSSRALVAKRPGTTRDYVEARLELGRHAVQLVDTAGLREHTDDEIELAGMRLSRSQLAGADLLLWLQPCDAASPLLVPEAAADVGTVWVVRSKCDLENVGGEAPEGEAAGWTLHRVSAHEPNSVASFRGALEAWVRGNDVAPWVGLARHRDRASEARAALHESAALLESGSEVELVAFALQMAQRRLEEIDGRSQLGPVGARVLDAIFSTFCIGK